MLSTYIWMVTKGSEESELMGTRKGGLAEQIHRQPIHPARRVLLNHSPSSSPLDTCCSRAPARTVPLQCRCSGDWRVNPLTLCPLGCRDRADRHEGLRADLALSTPTSLEHKTCRPASSARLARSARATPHLIRFVQPTPRPAIRHEISSLECVLAQAAVSLLCAVLRGRISATAEGSLPSLFLGVVVCAMSASSSSSVAVSMDDVPAADAAAAPAVPTAHSRDDSAAAPQPAAKRPRTDDSAAVASQCVNDATVAAASSSSSSSPSPAPLFVGIIGGGLAGLSVALSLQAVGIRCRVFERDASLAHRKQGFGLTLTNSPVGALAQLGVLDSCLDQDCPSASHYVFDTQGQILGYYGRAFLSAEQVEKERKGREAAEAARRLKAASAASEDSLPAPAASPLFFRSPTSIDPANQLPMPSPSDADISASPPAVAAASWPASSQVSLQAFAPSSSLSSAASVPSAASTSAASAVAAATSSAASPSPSPSAAASASPSPARPKCWSSANLRIPRQDLRKLLYDRLLPDTVVWGARVKDYTESSTGVRVEFHDGTFLDCSMLVGADGIHSVIRRLQDSKAREKTAPLSFLGVAAIVGLSPAQHPLLDARGFYALGDRHRLFTMPFRAATYNADGSVLEPSITMWQLSFAEENEETARVLGNTPPGELLTQALKRTNGWMAPVAALLSATPLEHVWATALHDRAARRLRSKQQASFVTVVGDACHPMSMFKGQGANQALQDGPLLAKLLTIVDRNTPPSALDTSGKPILTPPALLNRIRRFEAQMVQRADPRVRASRAAAAALHAPGIATPSEFFGVGGVPLSGPQILRVLAAAREQHVGAQCNENLDAAFGALLDATVPPAERDASKRAPSEEAE